MIFVFFSMFTLPLLYSYTDIHFVCSFQRNLGRPRVQVPSLRQAVIDKSITVPILEMLPMCIYPVYVEQMPLAGDDVYLDYILCIFGYVTVTMMTKH
jgi:hypothetical protein